MIQMRTLILASLACCFASAAWAGDSPKACIGYGKYGATRTVSGKIVAAEIDGIGIGHIVVRDERSGCRVFALASDLHGCASGHRFEGVGRLRSDYKGDDYDATLALGRDKGTCS